MNCYLRELEEMFIMVKLLKINEERHKGSNLAEVFSPLRQEDIYEIYITVFDRIDGLVRSEYDDFNQNTTYKFVTDAMTEYFHLAFEYGELMKLPKKDNPCFNRAFSHLRNTLGSIQSYCYDFRIYPSKSRKTRLYFITYDEYWMPYETVAELYSFFDYFPKMLPKLKKKIETIKRSKTKQSKRRKAA
jgi:hypothetical protein